MVNQPEQFPTPPTLSMPGQVTAQGVMRFAELTRRVMFARLLEIGLDFVVHNSIHHESPCSSENGQ
jgi:hypothetical protein